MNYTDDVHLLLINTLGLGHWVCLDSRLGFAAACVELRKFFETLTAPPPADDSASEVPLAHESPEEEKQRKNGELLKKASTIIKDTFFAAFASIFPWLLGGSFEGLRVSRWIS